ncbi:DUF2071 domain-containing protein [Streptomyces sp. Caat 7-52]|uniref:DUF2071 domain-containing protein n=2 Tax=Streptomyces sp. Caat 7-52 TaxID=2949637 RepID=UPI00203551D9|nr:DUF2071 domain-containing protein [Streptomyces sp. Caat 7-52]
MRHLLQRHPVAIRTHFAHSLVLTYALPAPVLRPLVPAGLELETYGEHGFVAVALVDTRALRPAVLPARWGADYLLTGYRIFTRFRTPGGRVMRGLRILRSDTDRRLMVLGGNLLTRYNYRLARISSRAGQGTLEFRVDSADGTADLHVRADLAGAPGPLPPNSPFPNARAARRFAGPLPYTFEYEPQTRSVIVIKAFRAHWEPRPVTVDVRRLTFFDHGPFAGTRPVLANAFHVAGLDYGWERGRRRSENGGVR